MLSDKKSPWMDDLPMHEFPSLPGDLAVDAVVIGGGLTGLTAATLLARNGCRVALVEAHEIASGDTGLTTAHITAVLDTRYHDLIARFGESGARLAASSHQAAIELIAQLVREEEIDCAFERVPAYLYTEGKGGRDEIRRELMAARRVGLECSVTGDVPLPYPVALGLRFEDQAQFHPRRYALGLAGAIVRRGGLIFERTRATEVVDGNPARVVTNHGVLSAGAVVVATHTPVNNRFFLITKIVPYRTYAVTLKIETVPRGLFYDTEDPYHYLRTHTFSGTDQLILGGADHRVGRRDETVRAFDRLQHWSGKHFGVTSFEHAWSGQVFEPVDGLPYAGRNSLSRHIFVATGLAGTGMTSGTVSARLVSDLIVGRGSDLEALYQATRVKPLASAKAYARYNVGFPAHLVGDRLKRHDEVSPEELHSGEGRVIESKGRKLAVYRDPSGAVTALSATCTHFGCLVHWNSAEKSWDCPCHGSRFDVNGEVLEGPATQALVKVGEAPPVRPEVEALPLG